MSLAPSLLRRRVVAAVAAAGVAVASLAHCSNPSDTQVATSSVIGPSGGAIASYDYVVELLVPPGALSQDETISIAQVNSPGAAGALAPAYTIGPKGLTFAAPAVVSFAQGALAAQSFHDPTDLRVAAYASGSWAPLANAGFDPLAGTIEGTVASLGASPYSVVIPTGGTCVTVTNAGGSCDPAYPGKCAAYAGAVADSCSTAASGATVSCCFPQDEPLCFVERETHGCASPCGAFPGSSVASCIPDVGPPLGAGTPGGLPQSTCCFASGAPVCVGVTAAGCPSGAPASSNGACCYPVGTIPSSLPLPLVDAGAAGTPGDAGATPDDGGTGVTDDGGAADGGG